MLKQPQSAARASHLFTLRVWLEEIDDETREWRGRIHHVESNETRYFRDWAALLPVLLAMVRQAQTPPPDSPLGVPPGDSRSA